MRQELLQMMAAAKQLDPARDSKPFSPSTTWDIMLGTGMDLTYFYPWGCFHPVRSGADKVARAHMKYFQMRGIRPTMIMRLDGSPADVSAFEQEYSWVKEVCWIRTHDRPHIDRCFGTWSFDSYLAGFTAICDVPAFRAMLGRPADVVFVNYAFSAPLLDAMPRKAVRILESHDFISRQFLRPGSAPALAAQHLSFEFELYSLFDTVLMINEQEARLANERGASNAVYVPQPVELLEDGKEAETDGSPIYDLLLVGSEHPPNVEGADWFYRHVFVPHLKKHGLRWAIVGSMCRALSIRDGSVHLLGMVEDIDNIYTRAKVVVIPLFRGAGISIKTLEALGRAKPIVTTSCGRRGLKDCDDALVELDFQADPSGVADHILHLCASRRLRDEFAARARQYVRQHFSEAAYARHLDRIFESVLPGRLAGFRGGALRAA